MMMKASIETRDIYHPSQAAEKLNKYKRKLKKYISKNTDLMNEMGMLSA